MIFCSAYIDPLLGLKLFRLEVVYTGVRDFPVFSFHNKVRKSVYITCICRLYMYFDLYVSSKFLFLHLRLFIQPIWLLLFQKDL